MTDRLQRSRADSAQLLHAATELSQREARLCTRRDAIMELEAALSVPLTQRNILCASVVSDDFFDALESAHAVCRCKSVARLPFPCPQRARQLHSHISPADDAALS